MSLALAEALISYGAAEDALGLSEGLLTESRSWRERHAVLRIRGRAQLLTAQPAAAESTLEQAIALTIDNNQPGLAVDALLDGWRAPSSLPSG